MEDNNQQVDESVDQQQDAGGEVDPIVNLKSEFSRKLENQNSRFNDLNNKLENIYQSIVSSRQQQAAPQQQQPKIGELLVDDPDTAARVIEERVAARAENLVNDRITRAQATQSAVLDVQSRYPEFAQEGSEAAKLAISKAANLPNHLKGTPEGVKMVMLETAAELGLVPASRRQAQRSSSDDFSLSGQSQGQGSRQGQRKDPSKEVDPMTLEFAKLLDPNMDAKRLEGLKKASTRKRWNQYE